MAKPKAAVRALKTSDRRAPLVGASKPRKAARRRRGAVESASEGDIVLVADDSRSLSVVPARPRDSSDMAIAEEHVRGLLGYLGEDVNREGLLETPARVVRAMSEHFAGYRQDAAQLLAKTFEEVEGYDELVLVSDIELFSHCEHHMVPFVGKAHVAYIPDGRVVGLSKLARVVDVYAKRLQVQEKLTKQIADAIQQHLKPHGVAVIVQCQHFCMCYRGVKKPGSWTTTSKLHGIFLKDAAARMELFTVLGLKRQIGAQGM